MPTWLPKVRVAACNVAPVFLDTAKTVQKTITLIQEAARNRADLVVFPETHIPAFPLWSAISAPIDNHYFFSKLASESLLITSKEISLLRQTCALSKIYAHIGFNERSASSLGCLWNASILINDQGQIVNHHRKLVPTYFEKLTWAPGDGAGLRVVESERIGKVGSLICGENTNPLARWALMAQGEQLHVSTWPAVWPTRRPKAVSDGGKQYDNIAANRTRTAAHCFEAKCFGVLCSGFMDREMRDEIVKHAGPAAGETLDSLTQGASLFLGPTGAQVGEQVQGEEGIAYADLDLSECVEPKQFHDVVGGYQRFDVFDLKVNMQRLGAENAFATGSREEAMRRQGSVVTEGQPKWSFDSLPRREEDASTGTDAGLERLRAELDGMKDDALESATRKR
ncbi:putative carbon-nitrogen hydrolase, nitrilase/Cyanide hydratase [Septoria linicola]|nr:putative carbon-nitrogen hydrolase, nitrilase/Cyanide hydratase [Septoria linicola]